MRCIIMRFHLNIIVGIIKVKIEQYNSIDDGIMVIENAINIKIR